MRPELGIFSLALLRVNSLAVIFSLQTIPCELVEMLSREARAITATHQQRCRVFVRYPAPMPGGGKSGAKLLTAQPLTRARRDQRVGTIRDHVDKQGPSFKMCVTAETH